MIVSPNDIAPSQEYLKPDTVKFIFDCIKNNQPDKLPPPPIVIKDNNGELVAVDGHNLIAVKHFFNEEIEVHLATNESDGILEASEANSIRNQELRNKFELVVKLRNQTQLKGIRTFADLVEKYKTLFEA